MKTMDEGSSPRTQPTSPSHDASMPKLEKKVQFGGWNKRPWREIRRKIRLLYINEEKDEIKEAQLQGVADFML